MSEHWTGSEILSRISPILSTSSFASRAHVSPDPPPTASELRELAAGSFHLLDLPPLSPGRTGTRGLPGKRAGARPWSRVVGRERREMRSQVGGLPVVRSFSLPPLPWSRPGAPVDRDASARTLSLPRKTAQLGRRRQRPRRSRIPHGLSAPVAEMGLLRHGNRRLSCPQRRHETGCGIQTVARAPC